jgi:hypothetical protein
VGFVLEVLDKRETGTISMKVLKDVLLNRGEKFEEHEFNDLLSLLHLEEDESIAFRGMNSFSDVCFFVIWAIEILRKKWSKNEQAHEFSADNHCTLLQVSLSAEHF